MAGKEEQMIYLGKKIKAAREQIGLTQDKLADLVGVSRAAVARWENGDIEPKLKNLIALTEALNVSSDYLLGISEDLFDGLDLSEKAVEALILLLRELRKQ